MKATKATAVALMALGIFGTAPAVAGQNEVLAILNGAENDSTFGLLSYRRSLGPSLDGGLSFRIDVSRGTFDVPGSEGSIDTTRVLLGYRIAMSGSTNVTFYGGVSLRERDYSVVLPGLEEFDETGAFASVELNSDLADGSEVFSLAEYDSNQDLFFASAFYQFNAGPVKVGPTVNYLQEGDYQRRALGLRVTVPVNEIVDVTATGAWAEGDTGGPSVASSYLEMQVRARF